WRRGDRGRLVGRVARGASRLTGRIRRGWTRGGREGRRNRGRRGHGHRWGGNGGRRRRDGNGGVAIRRVVGEHPRHVEAGHQQRQHQHDDLRTTPPLHVRQG